MTIGLLIGLFVTVLAFLVILDRRDERANRERDHDREERQTLLQRIQAPQQAVYEHAAQGLPQDPSGLPPSDEQIAEQEERERMIELLERAENGGTWPR